MNQTVVLGGLIAIISGLLWRKLDGIENRLDKVDATILKLSDRLTAYMGDFREFKGKAEALLGAAEKKPAPVEVHQ